MDTIREGQSHDESSDDLRQELVDRLKNLGVISTSSGERTRIT
jgi:hypothetical protein